MKKYKVKIKGIHPLIWNVMKKEIEDEKKRLKKNEMPEWEENEANWKRKAEIKGKDSIVIPSRWIKSMLINACKQTRLVPHFANKKSATYTIYMQSMMIEDSAPICRMKDLKPYGAYVGAQGKNSSTKVWRIRPMKENWDTIFLIVDPYGRMKTEELKELLEYSGMFIGLGDNRINNFGRFEVDKIQEVK